MERLEQEITKFEKERAEFKERFIAWLREGNEKSYAIPIPDGPPRTFFLVRPTYTNDARLNKIRGTVILDAEFRDDGTIGDIIVKKKLSDGLTQRAMYALRQVMFVPKVKEGRFVTTRAQLEMTFELY